MTEDVKTEEIKLEPKPEMVTIQFETLRRTFIFFHKLHNYLETDAKFSKKDSNVRKVHHEALMLRDQLWSDIQSAGLLRKKRDGHNPETQS